MNKLFCIILPLLLVLSAYAQKDQKTAATHDPKAKEILDKVSAKTKLYKTIKAEFVINREDKKDSKKSNSQKGAIWIKGNKYKLDILGAITFCDGKTRWAYIKDSKEINITEPDAKTDNLIDPSKVFTIYEKGYKYKYMNEKFEDGLQLHEIDLFPEDLKTKLSRLSLSIEKNENRIHAIKYVEKDGATITVKISKFTPDNDVSDADVTYNKANFPGAEVIDMR